MYLEKGCKAQQPKLRLKEPNSSQKTPSSVSQQRNLTLAKEGCGIVHGAGALGEIPLENTCFAETNSMGFASFFFRIPKAP